MRLAFAAVVACSCAGSQVATLRREQREHFAELHAEVVAAREEAARARCEAQLAAIDARVTRRAAECRDVVEQHAACLEHENASGLARAELACGVLGLVSAGIAGAACEAAVTIANNLRGDRPTAAALEKCGPMPACLEHPEHIELSVLREEGLSNRPDCSSR